MKQKQNLGMIPYKEVATRQLIKPNKNINNKTLYVDVNLWLDCCYIFHFVIFNFLLILSTLRFYQIGIVTCAAKFL